MKSIVLILVSSSIFLCGIYGCSKSTSTNGNGKSETDRKDSSSNHSQNNNTQYTNNPNFISFDSSELTLPLDINSSQYIPKILVQNTYTSNLGVLTFSVADTTIGQIISNGSSIMSTVRGLRVGKTTLIAKIINTQYLATCILNIVGDPMRNSAYSIVLSCHDTALTVGDSLKLPATITPSNTNVYWSSSNQSVISVNIDGEIKALKSGTSQISVRDYLGKTIDKCNIHINDKTYQPKITVENPTITMNVGDAVNINAKANDEKGNDVLIYYLSTDNNVATVNSLGTVKAVWAGDVEILLRAGELTKTVNVHVNPTLAQSISLSSTTLNVTYPTVTSGTLLGTINPSNVTNKTINWQSTNQNMVFIWPSQTLSGSQSISLGYNVQPSMTNLNNLLGSARITATSDDGKASSQCTVNLIESFEWTGRRLSSLFSNILQYYHNKANQLIPKGNYIFEDYTFRDLKLPNNMNGVAVDYDYAAYVFTSVYRYNPNLFTLTSTYGYRDSQNSPTIKPSNFNIYIQLSTTYWSFAIGDDRNYVKHTYQFSDKVNLTDIETLINNAFQTANL